MTHLEIKKINDVSLPSTIKQLEADSLYTIDSVNFVSGICNGVVIASDEWTLDVIVTPNTCVLGQNINS